MTGDVLLRCPDIRCGREWALDVELPAEVAAVAQAAERAVCPSCGNRRPVMAGTAQGAAAAMES